MTIHYLCPVNPYGAQSGGTKKLADHVEILKANGFEADCLLGMPLEGLVEWHDDDLCIVPEVYGSLIDELIPRGIRRVGFVQCGYLLDTFRVDPNLPHPYLTTPDLIAVWTESDHSTDLLKLRVPDLQVPVVRTHSCGNAREGKEAGFHFGNWPRRPVVMYFDYKHDTQNAALFGNLNLPEGWSVERLSGKTDAEIEDALATGAIFVAPNANEGLCAPASEAMISGCVIVGWPGGPSRDWAFLPTPAWSWPIVKDDPMAGGPMEYLANRAVIVPQDDMQGLKTAVEETAASIHEDFVPWAVKTQESSTWFTTEYSRKGEVDELLDIVRELL